MAIQRGTRSAAYLMFPLLMQSVPSQQLVTVTGVVDSLAPGVMYLGATPHTLVRIRSEAIVHWLAVPTSATQAVGVGESLAARGVLEFLDTKQFLNTQKGYVLRSGEKSMSAYMADMTAQAQAQAAASPGAGAVPTTLVLTPEQERQQEIADAAEGAKRRTDLLLTLVALIVALLAFERIQGILARPTRWVWSRLTKQAPMRGDSSE